MYSRTGTLRLRVFLFLLLGFQTIKNYVKKDLNNTLKHFYKLQRIFKMQQNQQQCYDSLYIPSIYSLGYLDTTGTSKCSFKITKFNFFAVCSKISSEYLDLFVQHDLARAFWISNRVSKAFYI